MQITLRISNNDRSPVQFFGPLEDLIMGHMWDDPAPKTIKDLHAIVDTGTTRRAYTTVMTTMQRLASKGLLTRVSSGRTGKADIYTPSTTRAELVRIIQEKVAVLNEVAA